jgi:DNA polymerase III sliding clamp (beta) subunit (PCNA family)
MKMTEKLTAPLNIPTEFLRAALVCASTEQASYYICGVYIDPKGYVVSTDGHRLFVARFDLGDCAGFEGFIIPRETVKRALMGYKPAQIAVTPAVLGDLAYTPIDGVYPDWRRVLAPGEPSGVAATFNASYVGDLADMAKALGFRKSGSSVSIAHNGDDPTGVTFGDRTDCLAIVMPISDGGSAARWAAARAGVLLDTAEGL